MTQTLTSRLSATLFAFAIVSLAWSQTLALAA